MTESQDMKKLIYRNLTGKKVLWLFIITNLIYAFMLFITIPQTMVFSNGLKLLDMMPMGYDPDYIKQLLETLGEQGRAIYLYRQIPVDLIYPFFFGISNCLILAYFLNKLNQLESTLYYLCFLPIIAGLADYMENLGIINLLNSFPNLAESTMFLTKLFTIVKSMTTTIFFVVLIIVLSILGIKWLKNQ